MTKDDVIRMAREVSHTYVVSRGWGYPPNTSFTFDEDGLKRFANLVAAHKAEVITAEAYRGGYKDGMKAAAVVCESVAGKYQHAHNASSENIADECAAAIRARGTT